MSNVKKKIMNFADGAKRIEIGQSVTYDNAQSGHHLRIYESTISKIGHSLVTLKNGDKFFLESGIQQTNYTASKLWSSKEAYLEAARQAGFISKVKAMISAWNCELTYKQALAINKIMGWDENGK